LTGETAEMVVRGTRYYNCHLHSLALPWKCPSWRRWRYVTTPCGFSAESKGQTSMHTQWYK